MGESMSIRSIAVPLLLVVGLVGSAAAEPGRTRPVSPRIPIATPEPVLFDLALDEVELYWSQIPNGRRLPSVSTRGVLGASIVAQRGGLAVVQVAQVECAQAVRQRAAA